MRIAASQSLNYAESGHAENRNHRNRRRLGPGQYGGRKRTIRRRLRRQRRRVVFIVIRRRSVFIELSAIIELGNPVCPIDEWAVRNLISPLNQQSIVFQQLFEPVQLIVERSATRAAHVNGTRRAIDSEQQQFVVIDLAAQLYATEHP
jgi:hypothetical protein